MEFVIANIYHTILYLCLYFNVCFVTSWFIVRGSREKENGVRECGTYQHHLIRSVSPANFGHHQLTKITVYSIAGF